MAITSVTLKNTFKKKLKKCDRIELEYKYTHTDVNEERNFIPKNF